MKNKNGSEQVKQQCQPIPPGYMYHYPAQDDEIDLLDLVRVLVARWKLIALVTVVVTTLAVACALLASDPGRIASPFGEGC